MNKKSAGILMYRFQNQALQVLLVHPGGPYWKNKDAAAWSIPKGEFDDNEPALVAAKRELKEETGLVVEGDFEELTPVKLKSGKVVYAWALHCNADVEHIVSNTIMIEWPPRSGKQIEIPEVDRAAWLDMDNARVKINPGQLPLLEELSDKLRAK